MTEPVDGWPFDEFVLCRSAALQRFGYLVSGSREEARDAAREILLGLGPRWHEVAETADAAARRGILAGNGSRWHRFGDVVPAFDPTTAAPTDSGQAARVFATLSLPGRAAVVLWCDEQASFAEVAQALGVPEGSARAMVERALGSLQATLAEDSGPLDPGGFQRAAAAFRSYLADQAGDAEFPPLALSEVAGQAVPPRGRTLRPALIAALAAAAVAVAGLGVHRLLTTDVAPAQPTNSAPPSEPTHPATRTPPAVADWQATTTTPLAARSGAIATWIDHEFVIMGGTLCPDASCLGGPAADGGAYDPATDRWRMVAAPPGPLGASRGWAVLGQTLYVIAEGRQALWAYDLADDAWRELPAPPTRGAPQLVALREVLVTFGSDGRDDSWFDPETAEWTLLPPRTYPSDEYPDGTGRTAVFTGAELLIGEPFRTEFDTIGTRFTVFGPDRSGRLYMQPSVVVLRPSRHLMRLVANGSSAVVALPVEAGDASHRSAGESDWHPVPASGQPRGPLQPGLVVGDLVSLEGNLFDPGTGAWQAVGAVPGATGGGQVQAGGPDLLLSCFATTGSGQPEGGCHLLRV